MNSIISERLDTVTELHIGGHDPGNMMCAMEAAWDAARDAAWAALDDTKRKLQQSAMQLVIRMTEVR